MASVFITGVAGFLGSNVARRLIDRGHEVCGIDNFVTSTPDRVPNGVVFAEQDIRDLKYMPETDYVIHTAAIARSAWPDDDEISTTNIDGSRNVFNLAERNGSKIIHCSSCVAAYPDMNTYAESKAEAEWMAKHHNAVSLRFSNIYGAGQSEYGAYPNVLAAWKRGRREYGYIIVDGTGKQTRDFLHVSDAARAVILAMDSRSADGAWVDICTGIQTQLLDIATRFNCDIEFGPKRIGDRDSFPQYIGGAISHFGFKALMPLSEGLKEVI